MAEISIEAYLKELKPRDDMYTIPEDKFTRLLSNYILMKQKIADCAEIKREYDILKSNEKHVQSKYFEILELKQELERLKQENAKLKQEKRDAISVAQNTFDELKLARAKK